MEKGIQSTIEECLAHLRAEPEGDLNPACRARIYESLGALGDTVGRIRRGTLARISAEKVVPIWTQEHENDSQLQQLLQLAERILLNEISRSVAEEEVHSVWGWLTSQGVAFSSGLSRGAYFACRSALMAVPVAWGQDEFAGAVVRADWTNADLNPWTTDAALCACAAYAGLPWHTGSDKTLRIRFWTWWLIEAVSLAWHSTGSH